MLNPRYSFLISFAVCLAFCLPAIGQPKQPPEAGEGQESDAGEGLETDRKTMISLVEFEKALKADNVEQTLEEFRKLTTTDPHSMVPVTPGSKTFAPIYRVLFQAFYRLPSDVRTQQNARTEATGRRVLEQILESGEWERIPELILQQPGSTAALDAHLILARKHAARGQELAVRAWLEPLLPDTVPAAWRETAADVIERLNDSDADEVRTESRIADLPTHMQWQYRTLWSPSISGQARSLRESATKAKMTLPSTWDGYSDADGTIKRTKYGVAAVNHATGKSAWEYPVLPPIGSGAKSPTRVIRQPAFFGAVPSTRGGQSGFVSQMFCRNNIKASITADSQRVYFLDLQPTAPQRTIYGSTANTEYGPMDLSALNRESGKRLWTTSPTDFIDVTGERSEACWYFGAPIPMHNRLYCIVEWNAVIRLACLSAETGQLMWTTRLAYPGQSIDKDAVRRLWNATPIPDQGLIWCPTTANWTVCIDELTRSPLWACRLVGKTQKAVSSAMRGRPVAMTLPASLNHRWHTSVIRKVGDSLIVLPHEAFEIAILNAMTGEVRSRVDLTRQQPASLIHLDNQRVVVAVSRSKNGASQPSVPTYKGMPIRPGLMLPGMPQAPMSANTHLVSYQVEGANEEWAIELGDDFSVPAGRGLRDGDSLLIPQQSGEISQLEIGTGKIIDSVSGVLPVNGWGSLTAAADGDLFYSSPETLLRIGTNEPERGPLDHREQAIALGEAGRWEDALKTLDQIPAAERDHDSELHQLQFRALRILALRSPEDHLEALREASRRPEEQLTADMIEVQTLRRAGKNREAIEGIRRILAVYTDLYSYPVPVDLRFYPDPPPERGSSVSVGLLAWATQTISSLTAALEADDVTALQDLPIPALLGISTPAIRPALHAAIKRALSRESRLQLIRRSIALAEQGGDDADLSVEAKAIRSILTESSPGLLQPVSLMLNTFLTESSDAIREALLKEPEVRGLPWLSRKQLDEQFVTRISEEYQKWIPDEFSAIPVLRTTSVRRTSRALQVDYRNDLFLREYQISMHAGEYGRLSGSNRTDGEDKWSVPVPFTGSYSPYTMARDVVWRSGSVLIIKTYRSLSAVSLLDQKTLWHRSESSSYSTSSNLQQNFTDFHRLQTMLPSARNRSQYIVVGTGDTWIAIQKGRRLEMLDLATGYVLWTIDIPTNKNLVVAAEDIVLLTAEGDADPLCLNRLTGEPIEVKDAMELAVRTITNVGDTLVKWTRPPEGKGDRKITWLRPLSGEVEREVTLKGLTAFHFVDDRTLAGFSKTGEAGVVDLVTGSITRFRFASEAETSADPPKAATKPAAQPDPNQPPKPQLVAQTSSKALWDPARVELALDSVNFYVGNRPNSLPTALRYSGLPLVPIQHQMRAVSRATGKRVWSVDSEKASVAAFNLQTGGLLVVIDHTPVEKQTNAIQGTFRGYNRVTGEKLFAQNLLCPNGLRYASVQTPRPNTLDISVYGQQVRVTSDVAD